MAPDPYPPQTSSFYDEWGYVLYTFETGTGTGTTNQTQYTLTIPHRFVQAVKDFIPEAERFVSQVKAHYFFVGESRKLTLSERPLPAPATDVNEVRRWVGYGVHRLRHGCWRGNRRAPRSVRGASPRFQNL